MADLTLTSIKRNDIKEILIAPYAGMAPNSSERNPKNYPYFEEVVDMLKKHNFRVVQLGVSGEKEIENVDEVLFNLSISELKEKLRNCYTWISVDSMIGHLGRYMNKKGIVIFSRSNPKHFGYKENINLYKDEKYFRKDPFGLWSSVDFIEEAFVEPEIVIKNILEGNFD